MLYIPRTHSFSSDSTLLPNRLYPVFLIIIEKLEADFSSCGTLPINDLHVRPTVSGGGQNVVDVLESYSPAASWAGTMKYKARLEEISRLLDCYLVDHVLSA